MGVERRSSLLVSAVRLVIQDPSTVQLRSLPAPVLGVDYRQVDQLGGGLLVGEVTARVDPLSDLAVQVLDRIRGVDDAAKLGRHSKEGNYVLPGRGDHLVAFHCGRRRRPEARGLGGFGVRRLHRRSSRSGHPPSRTRAGRLKRPFRTWPLLPRATKGLEICPARYPLRLSRSKSGGGVEPFRQLSPGPSSPGS